MDLRELDLNLLLVFHEVFPRTPDLDRREAPEADPVGRQQCPGAPAPQYRR
jgi:hypothetical protein